MSKSKKINKKGLGTINRDKRNLDIFRYQLANQVGIDKYSGQKIRKTKSITVDHELNDKEKNHELTIFSLEAGEETRKLDNPITLREVIDLFRDTQAWKNYPKYDGQVKDWRDSLGNLKLDQMDMNFPKKFVEICNTSFDKRNPGKKLLLSETTKHGLWSMMKKIIKFAYDQEWIKKNYISSDQVKNPFKEMCRKMNQEKLMTQEEYDLFLSELGKDKNKQTIGIKAHQRVFSMELGVSTGMRIGELFAIRYESIDLENQRLLIDLQYTKQAGKKGFVLKSPKKDSHRTIALSEYICHTIYEIHQDQIKQSNELGIAPPEFLFSTLRIDQETNEAVWKAIKPQAMQVQIWQLKKSLGITKNISFHSLRHLQATQFLKAGVNIKIIQARLGHSSAKITLDVYSHVMPGMDKEAVDVFDKTFGYQKRYAEVK